MEFITKSKHMLQFYCVTVRPEIKHQFYWINTLHTYTICHKKTYTHTEYVKLTFMLAYPGNLIKKLSTFT